MARWQKVGPVFVADKQYDWMLSHAANPVAFPLGGDHFRIYFSARDAKSRSHIGFVEIDINNPQTIVKISDRPVLVPGPPGTFDDSGASLACLVKDRERILLYYLGWNLSVMVPWRNSIGLAISTDGGDTFKKTSLAPIVDRNDVDPYSVSYPWVLKHEGIWRMWYGSNLSWGATESEMKHVIKTASSTDGINWVRRGEISVPLKNSDEFALSRPCVMQSTLGFEMWYSYRGTKQEYRIGYGKSQNGVTFVRADEEVGLGCSKSGWDSQSIEYPHVFEHNKRRYMLYCGNRYGLTGFGLAVQYE